MCVPPHHGQARPADARNVVKWSLRSGGGGRPLKGEPFRVANCELRVLEGEGAAEERRKNIKNRAKKARSDGLTDWLATEVQDVSRFLMVKSGENDALLAFIISKGGGCKGYQEHVWSCVTRTQA